MNTLTLDDPRIRLDGVAQLIEREGWWEPSRLPVSDGPENLLHEELRRVVRMPAGARIVFRTDASGFDLDVRVVAVAESAVGARRNDAAPPGRNEAIALPFDVTADGELVQRITVNGIGALRVRGLAAGRKQIAIWLPQFGYTSIGRLRIDSVAPQQEPAGPRWIAYGSSITQCRQAGGPSETWPSLVARHQGWQLTNLGFAAQCHLDPIVARYIRDAPAELISLCLGINIHGRGSFNARSLGPAIEGFINTLRQGHPSTPIVVSTPIACPDRELTPNSVGLTLTDMRSIVTESVAALQSSGDDRLTLLDGREILSKDEASLLADRLHPGPEGYRLMAERLAPRLAIALSTAG
jgi:hypothetical protein